MDAGRIPFIRESGLAGAASPISYEAGKIGGVLISGGTANFRQALRSNNAIHQSGVGGGK